MKMLEQRIALGVLVLGALSACQTSITDGTGSVDTGGSDQPEIVSEAVLLDFGNDAGVQLADYSDGFRAVWYDPSLSTTENATNELEVSTGTSTIQIWTGDTTGYEGGSVIGAIPSSVPTLGIASYSGPAAIGYYQYYTDASGNVSLERFIESATGTASIDFTLGTGTYSIVEEGEWSSVSGAISTIRDDGIIAGTGTFTAKTASADGGTYSGYSEDSFMRGSLFGDTSTDIGIVSVGNSHVAGMVGD